MKRLIFGAVIFVLGILTGASFTTVLIGSQIDALHIENMSLRDKLITMEKQIEQLKEKPQKRIISRVDTYVQFSDKNDFTDFEKSMIALTVEKSIREWLKPIYGQSVAEVNHLLIPDIIDKREIEVDNRIIALAVEMIVIAETVSVYIEVQPLENGINRIAGEHQADS